MEVLRQEAKSLHEKLGLIRKEILDKEKEIQDLRQANSKLVEQNLGRERKPASLRLQREKILAFSNELEEMILVKKSLTEKLDKADAGIRREKLKAEISKFQEISKLQLDQVAAVKEAMKVLEGTIAALEKCSGKGHCLYALLNLCWNFEETKNEIDLSKVLSSWSETAISTDFTNLSNRIMQTNTSSSGLWQQLNSIAEGKRSYPTIRHTVNHGQKVGTKSQVRMKMAGAEAKEVRENKHSTMKFVQSFPQERAAPPG